MTIFEGLVISLLALVPPAVAALVAQHRRLAELARSLEGTRERLRRVEGAQAEQLGRLAALEADVAASAPIRPLHAIPPGPPDSDARPHTTVGLGPRGPA